jgi:hypothetical protein
MDNLSSSASTLMPGYGVSPSCTSCSSARASRNRQHLFAQVRIADYMLDKTGCAHRARRRGVQALRPGLHAPGDGRTRARPRRVLQAPVDVLRERIDKRGIVTKS